MSTICMCLLYHQLVKAIQEQPCEVDGTIILNWLILYLVVTLTSLLVHFLKKNLAEAKLHIVLNEHI